MRAATDRDEERWDTAIGALYDSVLTGGDWPAALAVACGLAEATASHALFRDTAPAAGDGFSGGVVWNVDPAGHADYVDNWHARDPRYAGYVALGPGALVTDHDVVTQAEINQHPLYQEFLPAYGLKYAMILNVTLVCDGDVDIGFLRPARHGPFEAADKARLRRLAPHLQRAALLGRRLRGAVAFRDGLAAALDQRDEACLLVDGDARVLVCNAAAEQLLGGGPLHVAHGRLAHRHAATHAALFRLIRTACLVPLARIAGTGDATLRLPRPDGAPLHATVVPLADPAATRRPRAPRRALVTVVDPAATARRAAAPEAALRRLYGLTASEAVIAAAVAAGRPPKAIAHARGVAPSTVRSQLLGAFRKTGVTRQAELAALCGRLSGLDPGPPTA